MMKNIMIFPKIGRYKECDHMKGVVRIQPRLRKIIDLNRLS